MNRIMIALALTLALAFTPFTQAGSSSSSSGSSDGSVHGKIQSVSNTLFTINYGNHGHGRRHGLKAMVIHYNPDTTTVIVDGATVKTFDYTAVGKYASVVGSMVNNQLEATRIVVTSTPPAHTKKSKSTT